MKTAIAPLAATLLTAVLSACPGSVPTTTGITVFGKVLDYAGQPGAFLPMLVGGKVTSSDANGNFTASGISNPYQLVVVQPDRKVAQVYQGVSRTDPIVLVFLGNPILRKAKLTVSFSGTGTGSSQMDVSNPVNANGGISGVVAPGTSYTHNLQWDGGPSSFQGNICAILYQNTNNVATAINGFGEQDDVLVQDGQTRSANLSIGPVASKTITGTVSVPPGFNLGAKTLGFVCGGNAVRPSYPFTFDTGTQTSFAYAAPVTSNMLYMGASAKKGDAYLDVEQFGIAPDASGLSLVLPQPIELEQPANNALGIGASASFSWTPTSLGVGQASFNPTSPGPLGLTIYTSSASLTLPDLSALGYATPKGVTYTWRVGADTLLKTVNDALNGVPRDYLKSASVSGSEKRQFTTAP